MTSIAQFFDEQAERWDSLCVHESNKIQYILEQTKLHPQARILDVGCGTGILEKYLLPYYPQKIVAVDIAPRMIEKAKEKYTSPIIDFRCIDVMDIHNELFDYIILYSVFPHIQRFENLFPHLAKLTDNKGTLVICHSESKETINQHHHTHAGDFSQKLPPATELANRLSSYFTVENMEDNDHIYIVSGKRNSLI